MSVITGTQFKAGLCRFGADKVCVCVCVSGEKERDRGFGHEWPLTVTLVPFKCNNEQRMKYQFLSSTASVAIYCIHTGTISLSQ